MKPTVLIFKDNMLPASETFILAQGEGMRRFDSFYCGARREKGLAVPDAKTLFLNDGGVLGRSLELLFKICGLISPRVIRALKRVDPVLLHAHFGPDGVLALPLARRLRLPLVVTFHGYDATTSDAFARKSFFKHRKYLRKRGELIARGARFLAVSEFIKGKLVSQGFPSDRVTVHHTGIDLGSFRPRPDLPREPVVLFVGRLVEIKGCRYLIRAMQTVQESFPEAKLVVIGDGPLRGELESQAEREMVRSSFLGTQPPEAVREWMNRARIFCVPSVTVASGAAEGFGMVFAEAQAMGLPVVSSLSGGIPEAVADGETGLLAAERDSAGLAAHILRLLRDPALWSYMSGNGQQRVRERFDLQRQTGLLEDIYQQVACRAGEELSCAGQRVEI